MKNKFKKGDKVYYQSQGRKVWEVWEIARIQGKDVYWIGREHEFVSMVPAHMLKRIKTK